jgi:orotidine-5'-phosphate decarboxylase
MGFGDGLTARLRRSKSALVVGIDPRPENLPTGIVGKFTADRRGVAEALGAFGKGVVEAVAPLVAGVKMQAAFFETYGPEGMGALQDVARFAREHELVTIIDGKRNDIGSTAEAYARGYLGRVAVGKDVEEVWPADAVTINPYLGSDGVRPFIEQAAEAGKGVFVLVRTSNRSAGEFQDLVANGLPLYRHVAERVADWAEPYRGESGYSLVGAVVGATYPEQLAELRAALPGVYFLVPGYGAQGGTAADVAAAFDERGLGAIVNSSRSVIFAYQRPDLRARYGEDWQAAIAHAAREANDDLARHTPAGKLRETR